MRVCIWCALNRTIVRVRMSRVFIMFMPARVIVRQLRMSPVHRKVLQIRGKDEFASKVLSSTKPVIVDFHAE